MLFASEKPHGTRHFQHLLRNLAALFSHTLDGLLAGNAFPAVRAVFRIVRAGSKERTAYRTPPLVLILI